MTSAASDEPFVRLGRLVRPTFSASRESKKDAKCIKSRDRNSRRRSKKEARRPQIGIRRGQEIAPHSFPRIRKKEKGKIFDMRDFAFGFARPTMFVSCKTLFWRKIRGPLSASRKRKRRRPQTKGPPADRTFDPLKRIVN